MLRIGVESPIHEEGFTLCVSSMATPGGVPTLCASALAPRMVGPNLAEEGFIRGMRGADTTGGDAGSTSLCGTPGCEDGVLSTTLSPPQTLFDTD